MMYSGRSEAVGLHRILDRRQFRGANRIAALWSSVSIRK
jgi:hypothetical protein